jgi:prepilin-type N-terminal cleavage/methylation domain-containing protein
MRQHTRTSRSTRRGGFSLIEVVIATAILGTAVLGLFYAQHAFHASNGEAAETSTALGLANQLREMTLTLPLQDPINPTGSFGPEPDETEVAHYDDVDDFDGAGGAGLTLNPPVDATGQTIDEMADWRQTVTVQSVDPADISGDPVADGDSDLVRMTVVVSRQTVGGGWREMTRLTWLRSSE